MLPEPGSPETFSRFGGFWIDRRDGPAVLAERVQAGVITPEVGGRIATLMEDGHVVLPGAVPREVTAQIRDELDRFWVAPPEGATVETWGPRREQRFLPPHPSLRKRPHKLLDLHAFSPTARRAIAAPAVIELLSAIFETTPKVFQSLTFHRGSQQNIHKDTAYVEIERKPMHFAASWLALEDTKAGTGELQYYVGSHRDPDFLFGARHKWMSEAPEDHPRFLRSLHEDAKQYGHPRRKLRAKEGDVLVWHADLAHGGAKIWRRRSTRKSLVTHFTTADANPPYARRVPQSPVDEFGCLFISQSRPEGAGAG